MDDHYRQHETWKNFTQALGEFIVAYSWADKAATFLLHYLIGGDPNRCLVALYGMDARARCQRIKTIAKGFDVQGEKKIINLAERFESLTTYRNNISHSCFEWHPKKQRFSTSTWGDTAYPSTDKITQPKQIKEITSKAIEAEKISSEIYDYLASCDALSGLDPDRPSRIVEVKTSQKD